MKKLLLGLIAIFALTAAKAETTLSYGVCTDVINSVGTGQPGTNYSAAIKMPAVLAESLKGNKITSVTVGFGSGMNKNITVYLSYDPKGKPFYTQTSRVKVNTMNEVALDTPYEIEGKEFYIGYTYRQSSSSGKPIGFDAEELNGVNMFSILGVWPDGKESQAEWGEFPEYGALNIRATITGENLPTNSVIPLSVKLPLSIGIGKDFNYTTTICNLSASPVNNVQLSSKFGEVSYTQDITLDAPLAPGARGNVTLSGNLQVENIETPVQIGVTKVNGGGNLWSDFLLETTAKVSDYLFPRVVVIEEGTGVACGWCPAGYVALEQMREKYPDDFIAIAVHNYHYPNDPMNCREYLNWESACGPDGYPFAVINRNRNIGVFSPQPYLCEEYYRNEKSMVDIGLEITAEYANDEKSQINVTTSATFGHDVNSHSYGFALVQTEDNVGPYSQANNYSGMTTEMGGFEKEGKYVSLIYNDVARSISGWDGSLGSLPARIERGKKYDFTETMSLRPETVLDEEGNPMMHKQQKHGDTNVIALLIDRSTKEIVTAAKCHIKGTKPTTSVDNISTEPEISIFSEGGMLYVAGEFDSAAVYGIDGRMVASLGEEGGINVNSGIYVVRVMAGGKSVVRKIAVR